MTTDVCRWHITYSDDSQLDSVCAKPPQPTGHQGLYPGQRLKNTLYKHYSFSVFFFRVAARTDGLSSPFVLFFLLSIIFIAVFVTLGLTCTAGDGNLEDRNLFGDKISGCGSSWGIENDTLRFISGRFLSSMRRRCSSVGFFAWACLRRFSGIPIMSAHCSGGGVGCFSSVPLFCKDGKETVRSLQTYIGHCSETSFAHSCFLHACEMCKHGLSPVISAVLCYDTATVTSNITVSF